jgi:hypothetical protein
MLVLRMRLDGEEGAQFLTAIDSLAERAARRERAAAKRSAASDPAAELDAELDEVGLARERTTARRCAAVAQLAEAAAHVDRRAGDPPRREVVVHVDAAVMADDAAAGRAYIEGGPALHASQARRMVCEATVVTMLERGREVLGVGRARRLATRAQRRALLRRDGGCARPGCPESRPERLHAHHMRHWLHGGRTDLSNLVLLCDADHGVVHDLDLVMTRRDGRLVVTAPDGRRVWGTPDTAFVEGVAGRAEVARPGAVVIGVHPIDTATGRRPALPSHAADTESAPERPRAADDAPSDAVVTGLLFPAGEPPLPDAMHVNGERMDMTHVVGVLLGNRDLERRLAAEARGELVAVA